MTSRSSDIWNTIEYLINSGMLGFLEWHERDSLRKEIVKELIAIDKDKKIKTI